MTRQLTGTVSENRNGANVYLTPEFVTDTTNPLTPGGTFEAITIPFTAVVLLPGDADLDLPTTLTIDDPSTDLRPDQFANQSSSTSGGDP